jgi:hypothetical protein
VLVKIRAYNVDTLPMSIVVMRNLTEDGNTDSWTCPLILLQRRMLGGVAGDEDPLPPDGANPHPLPQNDIGGFWHDQQFPMGPAQMNVEVGNNNVAAQHDDAAPAAGEHELAPDTPHQSPPAVNNAPVVNDDPIAAITALLAKLIDNSDDIIPRIDGSKFLNAGCQLTETKGQDGTVRQLTLQFNTISPDEISQDNVETQDNVENMMLINDPLPGTSKTKKKQKKAPRDVSSVRRSKRIADLTDGFINSKCAAAADVEGKGKDAVEP